jgi:site-specific DNA recombinase
VMGPADASRQRCAIYTRKSSEEGLEQGFNSLAAQREACEAFIRSQRNEGWVLAKTRYDDGGFSGGNVERPALQPRFRIGLPPLSFQDITDIKQ